MTHQTFLVCGDVEWRPVGQHGVVGGAGAVVSEISRPSSVDWELRTYHQHVFHSLSTKKTINTPTFYHANKTYLINKNKRNQSGEVLFSEPGDVAHQGAGVDRDKNDQNDGDPGADPESERHVVPLNGPAELEHDGLENQHWTSRAQNRQRLSRKEPIAHPADETWHQRLHGGHVLSSRFRKQPTKGDYGGQAGEIQEYPWCYALGGEGIFEIWPVPRNFPF